MVQTVFKYLSVQTPTIKTFDCHHFKLELEQAACKDSDSLGWNVQLQCYLSVIAWWAVSGLIIHAQYTNVNNRSLGVR